LEGVKELPDLENIPTLSHGLQTLTLEVPSDTNHVFLARLLDRLFPVLQTLSVNPRSHINGEETSPWEDVNQMLRAFQGIREECKSGVMR